MVLIGREPVPPVRIGAGNSPGSNHSDDVEDSAPSSEPGNPEPAPPRTGDDDGSVLRAASEAHGQAPIAGDESSDHLANPPSGLAVATDVIQILNSSRFDEGAPLNINALIKTTQTAFHSVTLEMFHDFRC